MKKKRRTSQIEETSSSGLLELASRLLYPISGPALAKAKTYALNQKSYMENYLLDGRCSFSNNLAENSIRPFAVGRKSWLF